MNPYDRLLVGLGLVSLLVSLFVGPSSVRPPLMFELKSAKMRIFDSAVVIVCVYECVLGG